MLMSVLMVALMVAGCGTEKVENKVLTITVDGVERKGAYTGELRSGKPDGNGVFKTQNKDGSRYTLTGHFKDGKPDGEAILQFESGSRNENFYKDGKVNGKCKGYYANGKIAREYECKDGKLNGKDKKYYRNGNLESETEWKDGKVDGIIKLYYESGKLSAHSESKNGKLVYTRMYYESGQLQFEGDTNGQGTEYNENGSIKYKGKFVNGEPAN